LQNYEHKKPIAFDDGDLELLYKITGFSIRNDGVIQFRYQWDEPLHYNHHGTTKHVAKTSHLNVRIITGDHNLYFLVEKDVIHANSKKVLSDISGIIYNPEERLMNAYIVSDLIKNLELQDSDKVENKWFKSTSTFDKAVGIYGELDVRKADGSRGQSEANRTFSTRDQTATQFLSRSLPGTRIYISAKKSSVTIRAGTDIRIGLDGVEYYIRDNILPHIVLESID